MLTEITDNNFEERVKNSKGPLVIIFSSPWCAICKKVVPKIEAISKEYNNVEFSKINISTDRKKSSELAILSVPTILIFKDGKEKERISGDISEEKLVQKIEGLL